MANPFCDFCRKNAADFQIWRGHGRLWICHDCANQAQVPTHDKPAPKKREDSDPIESKIQREIRLALGKRDDVVVWRNNVGTLKTEHGQHVKFGLCVGSADLIGIYKPTGQFLAIECKKPGEKQSQEQKMFEALVAISGGLYCVARSVSDAENFLREVSRGRI